jgi:hypothetical protein
MTDSQDSPVLALCLPDDGTAECYLDAAGQPQFRIANQIRLPQEFLSRIGSDDQVLWFPQPAAGLISSQRPVINCCGDFDASRNALLAMRGALQADRLVFNHPNAIAHFSGSAVRDALSAVEGLIVPKQVRLRPKHPDDFTQALRDAGLTYPFRVQFSANHTNRPDVIVRTKEDWDQVMALQWPRRWFTITQMTEADLVDQIRMRLAVVGQEAEQSTFVYAARGARRTDLRRIQSEFDAPRFRDIVGELHKAVFLDYWTVEFSLRPGNRINLEYLWPGLPLSDTGRERDPSALLWSKTAQRLNRLLPRPDRWKMAMRRNASRLH